MATHRMYPLFPNTNGHTLLSLILEHSPPWITGIEKSRKEWIKDAILSRNLKYLQLLTHN